MIDQCDWMAKKCIWAVQSCTFQFTNDLGEDGERGYLLNLFGGIANNYKDNNKIWNQLDRWEKWVENNSKKFHRNKSSSNNIFIMLLVQARNRITRLKNIIALIYLVNVGFYNQDSYSLPWRYSSLLGSCAKKQKFSAK